ncbi:hypothetical protein JRC04_05125 [Mycolicibacterium sp. S2-37]|uniref:hypothetical protein n=1 Tax=Mycolicibacterium sp. S2-37 TaxID=2810297 RepID=UPI001A940E71|nr:hypothetical protein [Mycolicibacterium sp. S2-37]MBO0676839.1 hypothetical protein [Mycolicibacterium sp. S2-37]
MTEVPEAVWNFTAEELELLDLKPGDRFGRGIVGEPVPLVDHDAVLTRLVTPVVDVLLREGVRPTAAGFIGLGIVKDLLLGLHGVNIGEVTRWAHIRCDNGECGGSG